MDMHGEMGPIADKMAKAMADAPGLGQRMVGGGMCMEKFEDSPIIYENFAEAIWAVIATLIIDSIT